MNSRSSGSPLATIGGLMAIALIGLLSLPLLNLMLSSTPADISAGIQDPQFAPALLLSLKTSIISLALTITFGTPLAWLLAASNSKWVKAASMMVELPIVVPPAVVGVALLTSFGENGWLGMALDSLGLNVPFTPLAVIIAQTVVSAPFYVQAAVNAFAKVDEEILIVARTLGASERSAFFQVALPIAGPGLVIGASLAWARALGEFGATLLFAGNLSGKTQTMPLAIFSEMESDVKMAVVYSMALAAMGVILLIGIRLLLPIILNKRREVKE